MRGTKFDRHTTEAEDEEVESEKRSQKLFDLLKPNHRRPQAFKILRNIHGRQMAQAGQHTEELGEEIATGKNKVMQKLKRGGKKSSSFRKAA
jgi:hypothetical protein